MIPATRYPGDRHSDPVTLGSIVPVNQAGTVVLAKPFAMATLGGDICGTRALRERIERRCQICDERIDDLILIGRDPAEVDRTAALNQHLPAGDRRIGAALLGFGLQLAQRTI